MLLFLANGTERVDLYNIGKPQFKKIVEADRGAPVVAIGAYCLIPNHYHLLLKEIVEGGISSFMRKVGIAYTMYFNAKYHRIGNLFVRPFRSQHISTDHYFQRVLQYVHMNPAELYEPGWKAGKVRNMQALKQRLDKYPYSSLRSYSSKKFFDPILARDGFEIANQPSLGAMLSEARSYYAENPGRLNY